MAASYGRLVRGVSGLSLGGAEDDDAASSASSPSASPRTASAVGAPELRPLQRVASAVLDIPSPEGAPARLALVGPRHVPAPGGSGAGDHAAPACAVEAAPPEAAAPLESPADGLRGRLGPQDFTILALVGQGAFGKVFQVQKRDDGRVLAMKVMRKAHVLEKNADGYARQEQAILTRVDHAFVVTLHYSFQTSSKLYLVMDFVNGGHLFYQLYRAGIFEEPLARLYAAEVALALTHLARRAVGLASMRQPHPLARDASPQHSLGIIHRDLKPENILLDAEGHVKVTDFGLAAVSEEGARRNSLVGTIEYMAPEIVTGRGHSKAADWWSLGVLTFEMLTGSAPFRAKNRSLLQKKILSEKPVLPKFLSHPANRLLNSLLCRDEAKRLGGGPHGSADVRAHPFFDGVNWAKLGAGQVEAPFKPSVQGALCTANFDAETTRRPAHDSPAATPDGDRGRTAFAGYSYNREQPGLAQRHDRGAAAASAARQGDNQGKGGGAAPGDP